MLKENLIGQVFERLTVVEDMSVKGFKPKWLCKCKCGKKVIVQSSNLKDGHTRSCGCLRKYSPGYTSDLKKTRLYRVWDAMKGRCLNPNNRHYSYYGGRGITVCEDWIDSFQMFYDWSMERGYKESLTIERIDNDGNYEPQNCKWATMAEQSLNKTSNKLLIYKGVSKPLTLWCRTLDLNYDTVRERIRRGWSHEKALTTPIDKSKQHFRNK